MLKIINYEADDCDEVYVAKVAFKQHSSWKVTGSILSHKGLFRFQDMTDQIESFFSLKKF